MRVSREVKSQGADGQADADDEHRPNEITDDPPVVSPSAGKGLPFIFIHDQVFLSLYHIGVRQKKSQEIHPALLKVIQGS
jgi:hypothetical protein